MRPSLSIITPEPAAVSFLLCLGGGFPGIPLLSKKSLKKSSKGDPGGNCGGTGLLGDISLEIITETLTTDGINSLAKSEKSGISLEYKLLLIGSQRKAIKNTLRRRKMSLDHINLKK